MPRMPRPSRSTKRPRQRRKKLLQRLLREVVVIDELRITRVDGDRIVYSVMAHGGAARLGRALRLRGLLEEERIESSPGLPMPPIDDERLTFFYSP